jgi:hypothetical protein
MERGGVLTRLPRSVPVSPAIEHPARIEAKTQTHSERLFIISFEWRVFMIAKIQNKELGTTRRVKARSIVSLPPEKVGSILIPVRETVRRLPSRHWKQSLEKNLIEEGFTPARARELVELAAS